MNGQKTTERLKNDRRSKNVETAEWPLGKMAERRKRTEKLANDRKTAERPKNGRTAKKRFVEVYLRRIHSVVKFLTAK